MSNRLKLKVRTKIPAALLGGVGIGVTKDGLIYKIDLDYSQIAETSTFDPNFVQVATWNQHTNEWARVSLSDFVNGSFGTSTAGYLLQTNGPGAGLTWEGFSQAGTGAVTRTWQGKARDVVSVTDWDTATHAVSQVTSATGGGTIVVPNGTTAPTLPASYPSVVFDHYGPDINFRELVESGAGTSIAQRLLRGQTGKGATGQAKELFALEYRPVGADINGPENGSYALGISTIKQNWTTTTQTGEIGGITIFVRQGGADTGQASDSSAILVNVQNKGSCGYISGIEGNLSHLNAGLTAIDKYLGFALNTLDARTGDSNGLVLTAAIGTITTGILVQSSSGAGFIDFQKFRDEFGNRYRVDGGGFHHLYSTANPGDEAHKISFGNNSGGLQILNAAGTIGLMTLDQTGNAAFAGSVNATDLSITGTAATAYTPTATPQTSPGSFAYTATGSYKKTGKLVEAWGSVVISTLSTAAGVLSISLPFAVVSGLMPAGSAVNASLGKNCAALANFVSSTTVSVFFDGANFPATGANTVHFHISYMTT